MKTRLVVVLRAMTFLIFFWSFYCLPLPLSQRPLFARRCTCARWGDTATHPCLLSFLFPTCASVLGLTTNRRPSAQSHSCALRFCPPYVLIPENTFFQKLSPSPPPPFKKSFSGFFVAIGYFPWASPHFFSTSLVSFFSTSIIGPLLDQTNLLWNLAHGYASNPFLFPLLVALSASHTPDRTPARPPPAIHL